MGRENAKGFLREHDDVAQKLEAAIRAASLGELSANGETAQPVEAAAE